MPEEKIEKLEEEMEKVETAEVETAEVETAEVETAEAEEVKEEVAETAEAEAETETAEVETAETSEDGGRTLAEAIELAEKTAGSAVPKKKRNKKGIIAVIALVLTLALLFSFAFANTLTMSDEEYYPLLEEASLTIVDNSYTAIVVLNTRMNYYEENDYIDYYYLEALTELENSISDNEAMLDAISKAPTTYKEHYSVLLSYYESYLECLDLAINYGDDEEAYIAAGTAAFDNFIIVYEEFYNLMMADILVG